MLTSANNVLFTHTITWEHCSPPLLFLPLSSPAPSGFPPAISNTAHGWESNRQTPLAATFCLPPSQLPLAVQPVPKAQPLCLCPGLCPVLCLCAISFLLCPRDTATPAASEVSAGLTLQSVWLKTRSSGRSPAPPSPASHDLLHPE